MTRIGTITTLLIITACCIGAAACDDDKQPAVTADNTAQASPAARSTAAAGAAMFDVLAGGEDGAVDIEAFMPSTISVRQGDTIRWTGKSAEGHTITFIPDGRIDALGPYLAPAPDMPDAKEFNPVFTLASARQGAHAAGEYINSGIFGVPQEGTFSLTFPEEGIFTYLCMIHALTMRGTVVVRPPGEAVAAPDAVRERSHAELADATEEALAASRETEARLRDATERDGSGLVHHVATGLDTPRAQVLAFMPASLDIDTGDAVVFSNSERDFHNVVFAPENYAVPPFPIIKPLADRGGFRLLINPESEREVAPPPSFGPGAYFSSGIMGISFPRFTYTVRFDTPGTYRYQCTIHVLAGMAGVITVR